MSAVEVTIALIYGSALIWAAFHITRLLMGLVRPARTPVFTLVHATAVWSVGGASTLVGLALVVHAMTMLNSASLFR